MALTFSYGDYTLEPKPLFNLSKEYIKTPANTGLGTRYNLTIETHQNFALHRNYYPRISHKIHNPHAQLIKTKVISSFVM